MQVGAQVLQEELMNHLPYLYGLLEVQAVASTLKHDDVVIGDTREHLPVVLRMI